MNWFAGLETAQNALAVLTAMITPAVLISACGALIFSTSTRMGRVVDRVRTLSERFENLAKHPEQDDMFEERRALIFGQLDRQTSRARLLQRAMLFFYIALSTFVATSVSIAIVAAVSPSREDRAAARQIADTAFREIHVATPAEVCESRDPKGHYAKARAGSLPAFTGITNDYEPPTSCELVLDTAATSVREAAEAIERMLLATGVLFEEAVDLAANI